MTAAVKIDAKVPEAFFVQTVQFFAIAISSKETLYKTIAGLFPLHGRIITGQNIKNTRDSLLSILENACESQNPDIATMASMYKIYATFMYTSTYEYKELFQMWIHVLIAKMQAEKGECFMIDIDDYFPHFTKDINDAWNEANDLSLLGRKWYKRVCEYNPNTDDKLVAKPGGA